MTQSVPDSFRRRRSIVLHRGSAIDELDLWPGDVVLNDETWGFLGRVNSEGVFVPHLRMLN